MNVIGFGYFGRDHDDYDKLIQEPELAWLMERGGEIFLFGPPSDPQYFKWELIGLALSIIVIAPFLMFFTADSMKNIAQNSSLSHYLSGNTRAMALRMVQVFLVQCLGAVLCYIVPLGFMLSFMIIDPSFMPDWFLGPARLFILTLFTVNGHQFCIFFILKNPAHRKIILSCVKRLFRGSPGPKLTLSNAEQR
ncbi:hypothetical protein PRIPAC_83158, partial [Pristionchus pacificus]|uniref:Uncharacterized protein n=1 Tax=Pristionchus pacificus TaxID=54126 RepID=A0A2A6BLR2_PRIPA